MSLLNHLAHNSDIPADFLFSVQFTFKDSFPVKNTMKIITHSFLIVSLFIKVIA